MVASVSGVDDRTTDRVSVANNGGNNGCHTAIIDLVTDDLKRDSKPLPGCCLECKNLSLRGMGLLGVVATLAMWIFRSVRFRHAPPKFRFA